MSTLDKAFIKAYAKGAADRKQSKTQAAAVVSAPPVVRPDWRGDGGTQRVDESHSTPDALRTGAASAATEIPVAATPEQDREVRETLESASSIRIPTVLDLPSALTPEEPAAEAVEAFSPDWEVDRFVWPEICERLLTVEGRYFATLGARLKEAADEAHQVIMVAGSRRGEGRTTLALCLARCAAASGTKVAVMDGDLSQPALATRLGVETPCGCLDVISGKAPLQEAAVASIEDGLTLFPLTNTAAPDCETDPLQMGELLREVSAQYPLVILDVGPLGSDGSHQFATAVPNLVDAAIVVRDLRNTSEKKALGTAVRLRECGIAVVGIAENFKPID